MGVDIVAIHGLNGNAYSTWTHKNGTLWLKHLLPDDMPGSRIFTYGYPAGVYFSKSVSDIIDYSRDLLSQMSRQLAESNNNVRLMRKSRRILPDRLEKGAEAHYFRLP
jgi:hypothetical protein